MQKFQFARYICTCGADLTKRKVKLEDSHSQLRVSGDPASGEFTLPFADCPKCGHPWPVIEAPAKPEPKPKDEPEAPPPEE